MSDLERTGRRLQTVTIIWNLLEVFVTIALGLLARSLALVAFGLDSLIEVFASFVVLWHMNHSRSRDRDRRARTLVAAAFTLLALCLTIAGIRALLTGAEPDSSPLGIAYLSLTAAVMFGLAAWKARIGKRIDRDPFVAEARMTYLDGWLATAILVALALNADGSLRLLPVPAQGRGRLTYVVEESLARPHRPERGSGCGPLIRSPVRYGVVVQADELLPRSVVMVAPTSRGARPASFRPEIAVAGDTTRVLVEQLGAVVAQRLGDRV